MDRETDATMKRFAGSLKKRMHVERLILFGSRARGDHFVQSDFDVVVVSDDFAGMRFPSRGARLLELWDSNLDLEPLCYTRDEWERLKNNRGILLRAQNEGIRII